MTEKPGAAPTPAEAPAAAAPARRQDNLFFIEEPKAVRVTESEFQLISSTADIQDKGHGPCK